MPPAPELPTREKPAIKYPMLAAMAALALIAGIAFGIHRYLIALWPSKAAVFRQTASGWERLPDLEGTPDQVRVSSRGTVWVSTWAKGGLSRLEGSKWRRFSQADLGTRSAYLHGGFVLDGEDVWAAAPEGAVPWDGRGWHCYREAVASEEACSIAAGGGRVWLIDLHGNLSELDGTRWATRKLDLPGVKWAGWKEEWPKLARTADGTLWLGRMGLWRFDGVRWVAAVPTGRSLKNARLIGATRDRVWLDDGGTLRSVSADGKTWTDYPAISFVHDVASAGDRTWLASDDGISESEGTGWRRLAPLGGGVKFTEGIHAGPDGRLWVVGTSPRWTARWTPYLVMALALLPMIAVVAILVWMVRRHSRSQRQENERIRQAMELATGEAPCELLEALEKRASATNPWREGLIVAGSLIGGSLLFVVLRRWWPQAPQWMILIFVLAIHLAVTFMQSLKKRRPQPFDPIGPGGHSRYDWQKTGKALLAAAAFLLFLNAGRLPLPHFLRDYWILVLMLVPLGYQALGIRVMQRALWRSDYDAALKAVRLFHFYSPEGGTALRQCGAILLWAGRYRQAEDLLRRAAAKNTTGLDQAVAIEYLGDVLMEQGRNDEALRSYQAALHARLGFRRPYRGLAELTLRQGNNPPQALEHVENARPARRFSLSDRFLSGQMADDYWALKAWALGQLGRSAEVAPAIENAFKATNKKSRQDMSATAYRAGMAMLAIGNRPAANDYLKRARDLDPRGRRGMLAQAALSQSSVWGARA